MHVLIEVIGNISTPDCIRADGYNTHEEAYKAMEERYFELMEDNDHHVITQDYACLLSKESDSFHWKIYKVN